MTLADSADDCFTTATIPLSVYCCSSLLKDTAPAVLGWTSTLLPSDQGWPALGCSSVTERGWHHKPSPSEHGASLSTSWQTHLSLLGFIQDKLYKPQLSLTNNPFHVFSPLKRGNSSRCKAISSCSDLTFPYLFFLAVVE